MNSRFKTNKSFIRKRPISKNIIINQDNQPSFMSKLIKSESFLIAAIPVVCYLIYYCYWFGFFLFFNIPIQLLGFDVMQFISIFLALLPSFINLFFIIFQYYEQSTDQRSFNKIDIGLIFIFQFVLCSLIILGDTFSIILFVALSVIIFFLYFFLWMLSLKFFSRIFSSPSNPNNGIQTRIKKYLQKQYIKFLVSKYFFINSFNKRWRDFVIIYPKNFLRRTFSFYASLILGLIILVIIQVIGIISASRQIGFNIYQDKNHECLIEYLNSNIAICGDFDRNQVKLLNNYQVINISNLGDGMIKFEKLGPFKK